MDIHLTNQRLADIYGRDLLGQPQYRIVWANDEIEKRFSHFEDYIPGTNVLIRSVKEVRECKKYPGQQDQYILEKLFFNQHNKEILDNRTLAPQTCTYEPIWCFGNERGGRPKPPVWRAIELILYSLNNPEKLTPKDMTEKEFKQAQEDEKIMLELLNTHIKSDPLHSAIQDGDAVMLNQDYNPDKVSIDG